MLFLAHSFLPLCQRHFDSVNKASVFQSYIKQELTAKGQRFIFSEMCCYNA
jgi:hypothetical protein